MAAAPRKKGAPPPRRILEALAEAAKAGKGAAQLDGKMIDIASERMAKNVLKQAEAIAAKPK